MTVLLAFLNIVLLLSASAIAILALATLYIEAPGNRIMRLTIRALVSLLIVMVSAMSAWGTWTLVGITQ